MNKIALKFFCISIIFICCLAPLSAIDLNPDNATADKNQTIDINDEEIEIANETTNHTVDNKDITIDNITNANITDDSPKDVDAKTIENQNSKNETECNNLEKIDPNLTVEVKDIKIGEKLVIKVHMNETITKTWAGFLIWNSNLKPGGYSKAGFIPITDGYGEYIIDDEIPVGNYTVEVVYPEREEREFEEADVFCNFSATKSNPNLSINVKDSAADEKTIIEIHGNNSLSKSVNLKLNNSKEFTVKLENGSSTITIDDLSPGKYSATLSYEGDEKFDSDEKTAQFMKTGADDLKLRLKINDTVVGSPLIAEVYADESFDSFNTSLSLSGPNFPYTYLPRVKKGYGSVRIWEETKLSPGNYTAILTYDGDNKFKASSTTTRFEIKEKK